MPKYLKYLLILALAVAVFAAARHLDSSPRPYHGSEDIASPPSAATQPAAEETAAVTVPQDTEPAQTEPAQTEPAAAETEAAAEEERFLLTFGGDCILGSNCDQYSDSDGFIQTVGQDYSYPFRNISSYFSGDDLTLVNLECVLGEYPFTRSNNDFLGASDYTRILTDSSVEAVSLANDHTGNFGDSAYADMVQLLDGAGVACLEQSRACIYTTRSGLNVGFFATMFYSVNIEDMKQEIQQLRQQGAELVIVSVHWGTEDLRTPRGSQSGWAHAAIDAGADIVFGHHPKFLQPVETYNGGLICYSLGNLCSGVDLRHATFDSALLQQEVIRDPDGTVRLGQLTAVPLSISSDGNSNNFQPTPYDPGSQEYQRVMQALNLA